MMPRQLVVNERLALGLFLLFAPVHVLLSHTLRLLMRHGSVSSLWEPLWAFAWYPALGIALAVAAVTLFGRDVEDPMVVGARRRAVARALPIAALGLAVFVGGMVNSMLIRADQRAFSARHHNDLAGYSPRSIVYREGVPDGGIAIIRSPGLDPTGFSQAEMVELTGEPIRRCDPIDERDWACRFD